MKKSLQRGSLNTTVQVTGKRSPQNEVHDPKGHLSDPRFQDSQKKSVECFNFVGTNRCSLEARDL